MNSNPSYTTSNSGYTLLISSINSDYLEASANIYIIISTVTLPSSTVATSSFAITLLDSSSNKVESVSSGIYFYATGGTISSATVSSNNTYVNYNYSMYEFKLVPSDTFTSTAVIYIEFPDEINITNRAGGSIYYQSSIMSSSAKVKVTGNKYVTITNAFSSAFTGSEGIYFSLNKIINPSSVSETDSFKIAIQ